MNNKEITAIIDMTQGAVEQLYLGESKKFLKNTHKDVVFMGEAGECYADKITSVAELNDWDVDACFWKEEKDFEERTSELFQVDQP